MKFVNRLSTFFKCATFNQVRYNSSNPSKEISIRNNYLVHNLAELPPNFTELSRENGLKYLTKMMTIRKMENASNALYKEKEIRGFCHLYSGQEAVCVGMNAAMESADSIITAYRVHGWAYVCGLAMDSIFSELLGRGNGSSGGKGGSMHFYGNQLLGGNGIVGAQIIIYILVVSLIKNKIMPFCRIDFAAGLNIIGKTRIEHKLKFFSMITELLPEEKRINVPVGAGVALAMKLKQNKGVCYTLYGDGAANQGQVFEAYNMAKLWKLPCVFVCENNGYGMGTSVDRASASIEYYTRGDYIPGIKVDGMDVLAVLEATRWARDWCINKKGPIILEMTTYRYHGHSMSDPGTSYRTREEIQNVRKNNDPIILFKNVLIENDFVTPEEINKLEKEIKIKVDKSVKNAKSSKFPDNKELYTNIYKDSNNMYPIRGTSGPVFPIAISRYILIAAGLQDWSGELMLSIRNESDVYTDYEGNVKEELKRTKMIDWKEIHDWYHLSLIGISCVDEIYSIDWNKFNNKRLNTYVSSTLPEAVGLSSSSSVNCGFFKMMEHYAKFVEFHPYCNVKNVQLPPNITFVICNSMKKMVKSNTINFNTRVCECRLASMAIMVKLENADINKSTQLESLYSLKTKHNLNFINEILHVGTKLANIFKHSSYTISSFCEEFSLDNDILLSKLHHNITREVDDYYPNERLNHVINECNRVYEFLNLCLNEEIAESEKYVKLGQVINSGHES
ncbi:hypothetical protein A3Q56_03518 [Intoshia linei]|uniref:Dehydrogenase E1 component domain-containing protein n=1 Tax=Intoshia linei TaxID=1819745 RepID=A0A177B374_9BILA|nr:hypothetical protein A3Q56_03518 [Intoshia linei]